MQASDFPSYRESVRQVQTFLYTIAQVEDDVMRVNPDGIYSPNTAEAVRSFQKKYLDHIDGKVDYATWVMLLERYRLAEQLLREPNRISPFSFSLKNDVLTVGDRSDLVVILRAMLAHLGITYLPAEDLPINDLYDERISDIIRHFQTANGLRADGVLDRLTWDRLAYVYNRQVSTEA